MSLRMPGAPESGKTGLGSATQTTRKGHKGAMSTQNSITAIAHCHHRQRRLLRQAAATNARRRLLPSETFRFAPSRRSSLRSFRVLATYCRSPRRFTQCLRATHSHGHGRPWVSRGHSLPPASLPPAPRAAPGCFEQLPSMTPLGCSLAKECCVAL